jgi:hypothetical protein
MLKILFRVKRTSLLRQIVNVLGQKVFLPLAAGQTVLSYLTTFLSWNITFLKKNFGYLCLCFVLKNRKTN